MLIVCNHCIAPLTKHSCQGAQVCPSWAWSWWFLLHAGPELLAQEPGSLLAFNPPLPFQLPAGHEPVHASLHDAGLDLLSGCDHQGHCVREGGPAEGDHAHHGPGQRYPLVQLVHQQPHPSARERRPTGGHPESKTASLAPPCPPRATGSEEKHRLFGRDRVRGAVPVIPSFYNWEKWWNLKRPWEGQQLAQCQPSWLV